MNKNKISKTLLDKVKILKNYEKDTIFVYSNDFFSTKKFLLENNLVFSPYRFANFFKVQADNEDIIAISNLESVSFIHSNLSVQSESLEKDFINYNSLTEGKFFGQGQTICFIDTGVYPHLDFILPKNKIIKFIDLINKEKQPYDDNGHGTFVSGIACGNGIINNKNSGYAPLSNIISIKALSKNGNSDSNVILDAMQWIYENHRVYNITVVCMSFGADVNEKLDPLSMGAEALWKAGITVVAAAGNSGPKNMTIKSPGNNPYIITVGALDISNKNIAEFSSRGPTITGHKPDLLAPAVNIISCNNDIPLYTSMSGTSVATPIIAGICACIKSKYPKFTNNDIKNFLLSHCKKITGDIDKEGAGYICF